jgi:tetraacyldisaccharide 4'-kinase
MTLEQSYKKFISSPFSIFLRPLSWLYGCFLVIKKKATLQCFEMPKTSVISIGNVDFGGTGKTPTLLLLLELFHRPNVAVLTRGYKSEIEKKGSRQVNELLGHHNLAQIIGDEPALILEKFPDIPLFVGRDRKKGLIKAAQNGAKIIFLDDGAQYSKIKKHLNLVLVDPKDPIKPLVPCGFRRDTLDVLKKADLILVPYVSDEAQYLNVKQNLYSITKQPTCGLYAHLDLPKGLKKIAVLTSIARPERFIEELSKKFEIVFSLCLDDHARISEEVIMNFIKGTHEFPNCDFVCTQKDFVKIPHDYKSKFNVIKLRLEPVYDCDNWERFIGKIEKIS